MSSKGTRMGNRRRRVSWARVLCVSALHVSHAMAQEAREGESARAHENAQATRDFSQGVKLYKRGKITEALEIFRRVFEETRSPNAALYVGHCLVKLERYVDADTAFSQTLREIGRHPGDRYEPTREAAVAQLSWLSVRVAKVVIALPETPEGLVVGVDGQPVAAHALGSALVLSPGRHRIEARAPGVKMVTREIDAAAGETKTISFSFQRTEKAQSSVYGEPKHDPRELYRILGFSAAGLGAIGLTVFAVAGLGAKSTYQGLEADCPEGCSDADRRVATGKSQQTLANVGLSVGALSLVGSGVLLYFGFSKPSERRVSFEVSPGKTSVSYRGVF